MYQVDTTKPISQEDVLKRVNQFEIWWNIIGNTKKEFELFCNPFRDDKTPGCWLTWGIFKTNKVVLNDFAIRQFHGMDIFQAMAYKYNIPLTQTPELIDKQFNLGIHTKDEVPIMTEHQAKLRTTKLAGKFKAHMSFQKRHWTKEDAEYWKQYGINKLQLESDGVFPVKFYRKNNKFDKEIKLFTPASLCYAYTFETSTNIKLYQPYASKSLKWKCNTVPSDLWGLDQFPIHNIAIITKSYKDYRVLRNCNLNTDVYAMQAESNILPDEIIEHMQYLYDKIYILFDNDGAGIEGAKTNCQYINSIHPDFATAIKIDGRKKVKDSSDFYVKYGQEELVVYINSLL